MANNRPETDPNYITYGGFIELTDEMDLQPLWEGMYPDDPSELPLPPLPKGVDE